MKSDPDHCTKDEKPRSFTVCIAQGLRSKNGPILSTVLQEGGKTLLKEGVEKALRILFKQRKGTIEPEDEKAIQRTTEKMLQAVTMDDVYRFDSKFLAIDRRVKSKGLPATAIREYSAKRARSPRFRKARKRH